ncbi:MAG: sigma-54 interaction domain-containing protein, partial [Candidatus Limnocylindria bacterium]
GKELVARAAHYHSDRVGRPFVAANCKAFAEGVFESELFGHEQGAFTGAERARAGLFQTADGGTLFLDEIAELGPDLQAKLLRVLQERRVQRVGASDERELDVRVVAASNRELRAEVAAGRFREDLYFRLAVIPIHIPPLRERREDVLPLARRFLARWNAELGRDVRGWSDEVEAWLLRHSWPGNVRELENAIERAVVLSRGNPITLEHLPFGNTREARDRKRLAERRSRLKHDEDDLSSRRDKLEADEAKADADTNGAADSFKGRVSALERQLIKEALDRAGGNRSKAADDLGIYRRLLYAKIKEYGLGE